MTTDYRRSTHRARRYRGERTVGGCLVYAGDNLLDKHLFVHAVSPGGFDWGPDADDDRACQLAIALLAPTFGLEVAVSAPDSILKYDDASEYPAMYRDIPLQADIVSRRDQRFPEEYRSRLRTTTRRLNDGP
jgi:hypothetical protein